MPLPGVEPGLRPSQSRVPPLHLRDEYVLCDASTRTRTRNVPLEAGNDLRFTIEARTVVGLVGWALARLRSACHRCHHALKVLRYIGSRQCPTHEFCCKT